MSTCRTCQAIAGTISLTNAPRLADTDHWRIERVHPCSIAGWLVVVLRRHATALHELTVAEWTDAARALRAITTAMSEVLAAEKEYVMQFAEAAGHEHVHIHVVARQPGWPESLKGPRVVEALRSGEPVADAAATELIDALRPVVQRVLAADSNE